VSPAKTSFSLSRVQRALGIRTGVELPSVETEQLSQTIIVGDMSKSFASEQFEARGFSSAKQGLIVDQFSVCELASLASGGIVVERIDVFSEVFLGGIPDDFGLRIAPPIESWDTGPFVDNIEIVGGGPLTSTVRHGAVIAAATTQLIRLNLEGQKTFENFGWFIPSGSALSCRTIDTFKIIHVTFQWREISQGAGGP